MTCKSFRPPRLRSEASGLLLLALLAWAGAGSLHAQTPGASPTPKPRGAYVRFWNMLPDTGAGSVPLQLLGADNKILLTAPVQNYYATYSPVPAAAYAFTVRRPGGEPTAPPVGRLAPVSLRADNYVTVLVSEKEGRPAIELINDTPDPKAPPDAPGKIVVRHFIPDARISVVADRRQNSGELRYGETRALEGLPARVFPLFMNTAVSPGVPPKTWNAEVDFTGLPRRATLLVVGDSYGRFRPRLAYDGPNPEAHAAAIAETAAAAAGLSAPPSSPSPSTPAPPPSR